MSKILIIDDDTFLLDMYTLKFKEQGFEVEGSPSGEEALRRLRGDNPPDVVLFDVVMPGIDGLELLDIIAKEKLVPNALLIALSNQGESMDIEEAKKRGAHEYIVKAHMVPTEVLEKVSELINQRMAK
jgi:CheY-like chemotaxis protein